MLKRIPSILISISFVLLLLYPLHIFAQETQDLSWPLKEKEVEILLGIIRNNPLSTAQSNLFFTSLSSSDPNAPRETGAVVLVKQAILKKQLNYWFKDVPREFSKKFLKAALGVGLTIATQGSYGAQNIINQIEKLTIKKANEYALNWFLQNEIKVGSGKAKYNFSSYKGNPKTINIQYIIVYHPINQTHGKIVVEFYSKEPIEPPVGTSPNALGRPMDNPNANSWPWDRWLENERQKDNDGKLEPFIVRVKGYVKKDTWGNFEWDKSKSEPVVEVDFDKPVPEIEQSDIILRTSEKEMKKNYLVKKILNPLFERINATKGPAFEKFKKIKEIAEDLINKIKNFSTSFKLGAQIAQNSLPLSKSPPPRSSSLSKTKPL